MRWYPAQFEKEAYDLAVRRYPNCCLCGKAVDPEKSLGVKCSIEHIIPAAVAKWLYAAYPERYSCMEITSIIKDKRNACITCFDCNFNKAATIPSLDEVLDNFNLTKSHKREFIEYYKKAKKYINEYKILAGEIINEQCGKCYDCSKELSHEFTIRRIDNEIPRSRTNAKVVCIDCGKESRPDGKEE